MSALRRFAGPDFPDDFGLDLVDLVEAKATSDDSNTPPVRIRLQSIVQSIEQRLLTAVLQLRTARSLGGHTASDNLLKDHKSRSILRRMSTVATPPELAKPAAIWKLVILDPKPACIAPSPPASATINLSCLTTIASDDDLVVAGYDDVLSWHAGTRTSTSSSTAKRTAPVGVDLSGTAPPSGRGVGIACRSTFSCTVVSLDGRVAACWLCGIVLHLHSPYVVIQ